MKPPNLIEGNDDSRCSPACRFPAGSGSTPVYARVSSCVKTIRFGVSSRIALALRSGSVLVESRILVTGRYPVTRKIVLWLGHIAPTTAPAAGPITAPTAAPVPLSPRNPWFYQVPE